jgi:hypothetical protein
VAKRSRKRQLSPEVASSDPDINPDATLGPGASLDGTRAVWKDRESTNAPVVGEDEPSPAFAQGYPELIDRLLRDKIPFRSRFLYLVLVLAWFGVVSWLFVQDNQAGLLKTIEGIVWFGWMEDRRLHRSCTPSGSYGRRGLLADASSNHSTVGEVRGPSNLRMNRTRAKRAVSHHQGPRASPLGSET